MNPSEQPASIESTPAEIDLVLQDEQLADGTHVVSVRGEVDLYTAPELERALLARVDGGAIVVDLTDCAFIDSSGLQALIRTRKRLGPAGRLAIVVVDRNIREVFAITRLDRLVSIYPSRAAALNGGVHRLDAVADQLGSTE